MLRKTATRYVVDGWWKAAFASQSSDGHGKLSRDRSSGA